MNHLWPLSVEYDATGELYMGGCSLTTLAQEHGTPLYLFDEQTLRENARTYQKLLTSYGGTAQVAYAAKAFLCTALAQIFRDEGLDLDVASGGELYVALHAGFPPERIHFHGNNKTREELVQALDASIGRIVVDNFHELDLLAALTRHRTAPQPIWLRLAPGVQTHTHAHIQTGQEDTKFGFSIASGDAENAVSAAQRHPGLSLIGLHAHIGSQIYEPESLADAAKRLIRFAAAMSERHGFNLRELSPGGGWGVPMTEKDPPAPFAPYLAALISAVESGCQRYGLARPHLVIEPGRSLVARAAVALYTVGARKVIPGIRTYVSVDGGMADNIRPALYGASYTALRIPQARPEETPERVSLAGKYCESGDVLIRDIVLPPLHPGDLLVLPMVGAYTLSMSSNYNQSRRPAVLLLNDAQSRVIQRRERFTDLVARDVALGATGRGHMAPAPNATAARPLCKYHGLGNDYIVLDPLAWPTAPSADEIRRICDRNRGVGADGILYGPLSGEPFKVRLFNSDGSEFEKSGNGLRIFARYLWDRGLPADPDFAIDTPGGRITAHILDTIADQIALDMGPVSFRTEDAGVTGPAREMIEEPVKVSGQTVTITVVSVGNPHCVVFPNEEARELCGGLAGLARTLGPLLETLTLYRNRTNVQFAEVVDAHTLQIAIWERGAGYTLASGTSSCAAAAAAIRTGRCQNPVTVRMPGGELHVVVADDWTVRLTGSVEPIFRGEWPL